MATVIPCSAPIEVREDDTWDYVTVSPHATIRVDMIENLGQVEVWTGAMGERPRHVACLLPGELEDTETLEDIHRSFAPAGLASVVLVETADGIQARITPANSIRSGSSVPYGIVATSGHSGYLLRAIRTHASFLDIRLENPELLDGLPL